MLKSLLYPNNLFVKQHKISKNYFYAALFWPTIFVAQIGNYINNGSFEIKYSCDPPYYINKAVHWNNIGSDTTIPSGGLYSVGCFSNAPTMSGIGFQYPHSGETFARTTLYCTNPCPYYSSRGYPKNRLKANLVANKTYCVKMYVSRQDACPYATSDIGFYFGDNSSDTIKYANAPLTYLTPQVTNPSSNIIIDTLNWTPVTGTFVATGFEKYLVIGNFKSNAATTNSLVDTTFGNGVWAEYFIDDLSCIEVDLPAYAGPDRSVMLGDSVFIGREPDFAIDSGCTWYKLPNMATPVATISGLWVKPIITTTYVVKQVLECSPLKSDTVVVYMNLTGLVSSSGVGNDLTVFPNPASDFLELSMSDIKLTEDFNFLEIYNNLGIVIEQKEIYFDNTRLKISTDNFPNGVYFLRLKSVNNETLSTRFLVAR